MSVFERLNSINVSDKIEKKNGLSYLSWAWAWAEVKKAYPAATYTIYENKDGWNYHTDGLTGWVKTGVTIENIEHIEYLPIMDYKNKSIPAGDITSFDVNKAIQRSLTKACARHGLGLYIYAGEDLPEEEQKAIKETIQSTKENKTETFCCAKCGKPFVEMIVKGKTYTPEMQYMSAVQSRGGAYCKECYEAMKK